MIITKIQNVDDFYYDVFISISGAITGFPTNELQSTGLGEAYYEHILSSLEGATFLEFLNVSKEILETTFTEDQLNNAIVARLITPPGMQDILNNIATVWYLGTWEGHYVNDLSYKEGLVWNVMSSHPPGAKQPGFKSWSVKPINSNV